MPEVRLDKAPDHLKGDRYVTSVTDIACAIGVLLGTGAFIAWLIIDMIRG